MSDIEPFIVRWSGREGGQERANYGLFLSELCDVLGVLRPEPAEARYELNDYCLERAVKETARDGSVSWKRIDLYKRDAFVLEAKQSRQKGGKKELPGQASLFETGQKDEEIGRRGANRAWDVLMMNARKQAEGYVRLLPEGHSPPPFVVVCDVGHCFELYANFRRDGKAYDQFPDRQGFRIYLEDLRRPEIRERLKAVWTDPMSLDPARHSARVTREIAARLAAVSRALEAARHPPEEVAMFLTRLLFTMFAEDVDLLPRESFTKLLAECEDSPASFPGLMEELWQVMDSGGFAASIRAHIPTFNGEFFRNRRAFPLGREEIGELRRAAEHDWREVEPAIFGTLLEQALDKDERRQLGAHYTPRAYVERLVVATIIEPLREDWASALATAERQKGEGRGKVAIATVRAFHEKLCNTRVLDPACGTGNFLYVALELMKKLEGDVLEALADLGGQEALRLETHSVDPHTFYGMEINPRAAAIAELVLWIGHLQWHFRTRGGAPTPPILQAFHNIEQKDAVLTWDGYPLPKVVEGRETYPHACRPDWPAAEFIVGNPPFIGGGLVRSRLGNARAEALWAAHQQMNESADFVMYWWDRAAELLTRRSTPLRRFGFVTTNSISQVFQRRVMERHLNAKKPISLLMAIPDHPWTRASPDSAAVRIAMTVAAAGSHEGLLREVVSEVGVDTDAPLIGFRDRTGTINSDLTVGVDVTAAVALEANEGLCSPGVKLHGAGFIVTPEEARHLGLGRRPGLERHIRDYRNGRDLTARSRGVMVIDLFGLDADEARRRFPEAYQHLLATVKPERDRNNRQTYRQNWWIFGEPRRELRLALKGLSRYIATVTTATHRIFQFVDSRIVGEDALITVASDDPVILGVLSGRHHVAWATSAGSWLGVGNDSRYRKTRTFDPFPFPDATDAQKATIGAIAEELDAHRKRVLAGHPHLTLTGLYNVLERLRAGARRSDLEPAEQRIFDDGLVLVMKDLHDRLDVAVADAYGWPADLAEEEVLARLVALNRERAAEEKRGLVRWLRPDYQIPRFGSAQEKAAQIEADLVGGADGTARVAARLAFPSDEVEQTGAVIRVLLENGTPMPPAAVVAAFRNGSRSRRKVEAILDALTRQGVASTPDGGRSFSMRHVA